MYSFLLVSPSSSRRSTTGFDKKENLAIETRHGDAIRIVSFMPCPLSPFPSWGTQVVAPAPLQQLPTKKPHSPGMRDTCDSPMEPTKRPNWDEANHRSGTSQAGTRPLQDLMALSICFAMGFKNLPCLERHVSCHERNVSSHIRTM